MSFMVVSHSFIGALSASAHSEHLRQPFQQLMFIHCRSFIHSAPVIHWPNTPMTTFVVRPKVHISHSNKLDKINGQHFAIGQLMPIIKIEMKQNFECQTIVFALIQSCQTREFMITHLIIMYCVLCPAAAMHCFRPRKSNIHFRSFYFMFFDGIRRISYQSQWPCRCHSRSKQLSGKRKQ